MDFCSGTRRCRHEYEMATGKSVYQTDTPDCGNRDIVFLHGGWRCASTYIWSRFRAAAGTTCFYEPFSERLAHTSRRGIRRDSDASWDSHHPHLTAPYRAEYLPLMRRLRRGVSGYCEAFALERYFPRDAVGPEAAYLARLIAHARRRGTVTVLGFSRSLARAALLKHACGGVHVVIRRDPRQQWLSCRRYRTQKALLYFELCHFLILLWAPGDSPAGRLARSLGLPPLKNRAVAVGEQLRDLAGQLGTWSDELSYRAFLGVYLLSYAAALPAADQVVEVERLAAEAHYREQVAAAVRCRTGLEVDFSDCRLAHTEYADVRIDFQGLEADVRRQLIGFGAPLDGALRAAARA